MSGRRDGDRGAISNGDMTVNRVWRERGKDISIVDEVSGGTAVEDVLRWRRLQHQVVEVLSERRGVPRLRRGRGRGVGDSAGEGGVVRGAIGGVVGGAVRSAVGGAMPDTRRGIVCSGVVSRGMAAWGDAMKALAQGPGRGPRMTWPAGCGMGHI
jgi:hypothetical protein